jgi:hypothetical protein
MNNSDEYYKKKYLKYKYKYKYLQRKKKLELTGGGLFKKPILFTKEDLSYLFDRDVANILSRIGQTFNWIKDTDKILFYKNEDKNTTFVVLYYEQKTVVYTNNEQITTTCQSNNITCNNLTDYVNTDINKLLLLLYELNENRIIDLNILQEIVRKGKIFSSRYYFDRDKINVIIDNAFIFLEIYLDIYNNSYKLLEDIKLYNPKKLDNSKKLDDLIQKHKLLISNNLQEEISTITQKISIEKQKLNKLNNVDNKLISENTRKSLKLELSGILEELENNIKVYLQNKKGIYQIELEREILQTIQLEVISTQKKDVELPVLQITHLRHASIFPTITTIEKVKKSISDINDIIIFLSNIEDNSFDKFISNINNIDNVAKFKLQYDNELIDKLLNYIKLKEIQILKSKSTIFSKEIYISKKDLKEILERHIRDLKIESRQLISLENLNKILNSNTFYDNLDLNSLELSIKELITKITKFKIILDSLKKLLQDCHNKEKKNYNRLEKIRRKTEVMPVKFCIATAN